MKKGFLILGCVLLIAACKNQSDRSSAIQEINQKDYLSFGDPANNGNLLVALNAKKNYKNMALNDTVDMLFKAKVTDVCKSKGCWMKLDLENGEHVMVKFKDYGFFVPKDIENKEVIVNGKAFVNEVSVEEQRHYAEDAGKSDAEIAAIVDPKRTYSFLADGVLIRN